MTRSEQLRCLRLGKERMGIASKLCNDVHALKGNILYLKKIHFRSSISRPICLGPRPNSGSPLGLMINEPERAFASDKFV